ncbi:hypothetical protein HN51_052259 [Arachis hypogaea]|uniref:Uncharacterized protein n=1 Tax=Arachis hypogaea TaxID=3818 RepID=A0A445CBD9_ARAHY|nr:uncharacterized protein DS421_17g593870 [Arachis hypogaea]QHO29615.1 uncharacterized protein DS421_8g226540 [Arachis hypogaea]RYR41482.1 hypothetical protein Ahy_A08g037884 [Arachis hypogaea]RYR48262.1 hypothetical protein Ahy_A07g034269 [Arachis hypogaea]
MANSKLVFIVSSILLALVILNGTFSVLGRPLKTENNNNVKVPTAYEDEDNIDKMAIAAEKTVVWRRYTSQNSPPADGVGNWTDDFRPTDPGHSPGAGHSSPTPN